MVANSRWTRNGFRPGASANMMWRARRSSAFGAATIRRRPDEAGRRGRAAAFRHDY